MVTFYNDLSFLQFLYGRREISKLRNFFTHQRKHYKVRLRKALCRRISVRCRGLRGSMRQGNSWHLRSSQRGSRATRRPSCSALHGPSPSSRSQLQPYANWFVVSMTDVLCRCSAYRFLGLLSSVTIDLFTYLQIHTNVPIYKNECRYFYRHISNNEGRSYLGLKSILHNGVRKYICPSNDLSFPERNKKSCCACVDDKVFPKTSYRLATVYLHTIIQDISLVF